MSINNGTAPGSLLDSQEKEASITALEEAGGSGLEDLEEDVTALDGRIDTLEAKDTAAVNAIKTVVITGVGTLVFAVGGRLTSYTPE